jgi:hypothetical protein
MDLIEVIKEGKAKEINLQEADLQNANLERANLEGANLRGANLQGASLRWAKLQGANLQEANLKEANLQWAKLQGANLREANLQWAKLKGANLQETNLLGTELALYQAAPQASILGLGEFLQNHVNSDLFDQSRRSFGYGGTCCLASAAAQFVGAAGNSGVGVLAIKKALPNFNLEVLYQKDPQVVITELNKFVP